MVPTADSDTRQVTVVGTGEVQGTPDTLTISVSIEATAPDVTAAMNQTSEQDAGRDRRACGLRHRPKDISTTKVTLQPQYGGGDTPSIIGYQASNSIDVKIRKPRHRVADVGRSSAPPAATPPGSTRSATRSRTTRSWSRTRATGPSTTPRTAPSSTRSCPASPGQGHLDLRVGGATPPPPPPIPMPRAAMEAVPLEPGQQTVGFSVTVIWELTLVSPRERYRPGCR